MPVTNEEAARIARAYGMTLTDAATLITMAETVEEAQHIAIQFAGSAEERSGEAHTIARKKQDAKDAAELEQYAEYQAKHPRPPKPERKQVVPDLRDGMSERERAQATQAAHVANVRAEAEEKSDEAQGKARDWYAWKKLISGPKTRDED